MLALIGPAILAIFALAYIAVFAEDKLHLKKSKPVMIAAGLIWILVAIAFQIEGRGEEATVILKHNLLEYAELFLFLLAAMSFINAMVERNLFEVLRTKLVESKLSLRGIFWITGSIAFFLSPVADNLTTALVMGAVVLAVGGKNKAFIACSCINVVVAANAGGAFSPFGDITTLMVWQKGHVLFGEFFHLFIPSVVSWLIPATIMSLTIPKDKASASTAKKELKKGGITIALLFLGTIGTTVTLHQTLHLPPFLGMMMGLGALKLYGYFLKKKETKIFHSLAQAALANGNESYERRKPFDVFVAIQNVEWETLLFFYGIMMCVGGLGAMGYLEVVSRALYTDMGPTVANSLIGILSALVDNIPLTFAVLNMNPDMVHNQWLLLTLTAGIGGSLLSIGSAAGVALMGASKGAYTMSVHIKWSWAIFLGYAAGIVLHLLLSGEGLPF